MITIILNNLEAEMKRKCITRNDVARLIGVSYRTIHSRFSGKSQWRYEECILIRDTYFPDMDLAYLFPYTMQCEEKEEEKEVV